MAVAVTVAAATDAATNALTVRSRNTRDEFSGATRSIDRQRRLTFAGAHTAEQCNKWHHTPRPPVSGACSTIARRRLCGGGLPACPFTHAPVEKTLPRSLTPFNLRLAPSKVMPS